MTDMAAVTANDYLLWTNRESVTWRSRSLGTLPAAVPSYTDTPLDDCKARAITVRELAASAGQYVGTDRVWLVPEAVLPTPDSDARPVVGDILTDGGGFDWTILEATRGKFGRTNRYVTRSLGLYYQLNRSLRVRRTTNQLNDAGLKTNAGSNLVYTSVACRPAEQPSSAEPIHDGRTVARQFDVFVGERLELLADDKLEIVTSGGAVELTLQVRGWRNPDRIDELMVIQAELVS